MSKTIKPKKAKRTTRKACPLITQIDREHQKLASLHTQLIKRYKQSIEKAQKQLKKNISTVKAVKVRLKDAKTPSQKKPFQLRLTRLIDEKAKISSMVEGLKKRNQAFRVLQKAVREFQGLYKKAKKPVIHKKKPSTTRITKKKHAPKLKTKRRAKPKIEKSLLAHRLSTAILKINAIDKS